MAIDLVDHPKRRVTRNTSEDQGVDAGPKGVCDEAMSKQVRIDALGDPCALGRAANQLEDAAPRQWLVVAGSVPSNPTKRYRLCTPLGRPLAAYR